MELSTGKILEEYMVQSAFHQTLRDEFTFQQDNNLKHKAKSILELLTKKTVKVPELYTQHLCYCQQFNYAFLPTFTDTGHIQRVLSVHKFVSYSALWHTQTRVL